MTIPYLSIAFIFGAILSISSLMVVIAASKSSKVLYTNNKQHIPWQAAEYTHLANTVRQIGKIDLNTKVRDPFGVLRCVFILIDVHSYVVT